MTWGELKQIVLQKVFASGEPGDPAGCAYLDAVPAAAREGLALLNAAGLGDGDVRSALPPLDGGADDGTALPLCDAAAAVLPLYIASQLYKEDNAGIATQYRNEFEAGVEALAAALPRPAGAETWRSTTGWL